MEQHEPRQHKNKPMFKKSVSFSSYLKPHQTHNHNNNMKVQECDEICIFDTAKYFRGVDDTPHVQDQRGERLSSVSSSVETISSYKMRSCQTTPTASSEASWNSQVGLLAANSPGSVGVSPIKGFSNNGIGNRGVNNNNNNSSNSNSNVGQKWPRISTKWLTRGRKCPCLCKKSVQVVEETINLKTIPRMVDLRKSSTSSNCSTPFYSPRQSSPTILGLNVPSTTLSIIPHDLKGPNINCAVKSPIEKTEYLNTGNNNDNNNKNHLNDECLSLGLISEVVGPLTSYDNLNVVNTTHVTTTTATSTINNGFTFPILENQPIGLKKMFNVIAPNDDPNRDSIEVFQPRINSSPMSRRTSYEDENVSDASSDLFEIESISTTSSPYRDLIDEVTVPNSNFGTSRKKLGIIGLGYINQGRNNNNVDENDECYTPRELKK